MLDDLQWCFDTPANTVVELALYRLGVPEFYGNLLSDIDLHSFNHPASELTLDLLSRVGEEGTAHRQEHGTGQETIQGPLNWVPVADMVISVARASSTQPVLVPTGDGTPVSVDRSWYVDDSGLVQSRRGAVKEARNRGERNNHE